jgi:hypothetical protein
MSSSTWPGRPLARLVGRILALITAFLALLLCGGGLHGQLLRRAPLQAVPCPLSPVPCS